MFTADYAYDKRISLGQFRSVDNVELAELDNEQVHYFYFNVLDGADPAVAKKAL